MAQIVPKNCFGLGVNVATPVNYGYRLALQRTFPKDWRKTATTLRLDKLPALPNLPPNYENLPRNHDSWLIKHGHSNGTRHPWKYYAFVGDRHCRSFASLVLQKSTASNKQCCDAENQMVTNAVNARIAWSYGLDADLKVKEDMEAIKLNLKVMETMYEAYIGAMVIAAETYPSYHLLVSNYMAKLFTEEVFPDLQALKSVPAPCI